MHSKDERWLNQSGLNLIRIVIGSYFAAVALDLVLGVNQSALFAPFASPLFADLIGSTVLVVASLTFMVGYRLRLSALVLALFVFSSSLIQNFLISDVENVSAFWRDLTMVCAVILTYSNMSRQEMRRADLSRPRRIKRIRKIHMPGTAVTPRRVSPPAQQFRTSDRTAKARQKIKLPSFMRHPKERPLRAHPADINLFAEI